MISILLFVIVAWVLIGVAGSILLIGKERKPSTPGQAVFQVFVGLGFSVVLVIAAIQLMGI